MSLAINCNGSVSNDDENLDVLDEQNCIHEYVINFEHILQNSEIRRLKDVLNALDNLKIYKILGLCIIYLIIFMETKIK